MNKHKKNGILRFIYVALAHGLFLSSLFVMFTIKGCSKKLPERKNIKVSLIATNKNNNKPSNRSNLPRKNKYKTKKINRKRAWRPLKPEEILKSSKKIILREKRKRKRAPTKRKYKPIFNSKEFKSRLEKEFDKQYIHNLSTSFQKESTSSYHQKIVDIIYNKWEQPTKSELNYQYPEVIIDIIVDSDGKIVKSYIEKKSNIKAMDISVNKLLDILKYLPPPPNRRRQKLCIILKLTD